MEFHIVSEDWFKKLRLVLEILLSYKCFLTVNVENNTKDQPSVVALSYITLIYLLKIHGIQKTLQYNIYNNTLLYKTFPTCIKMFYRYQLSGWLHIKIFHCLSQYNRKRPNFLWVILHFNFATAKKA